MDPTQMFGAMKSGGGFNVLEFIRQPMVILRIVAIIAAIIVFGSISSGGKTENHVCIFHGDWSACSYASAIGILAFLGAIGLLVVDGMFNSISNVNKRRQVVIGELGFSGLWTFLWFVSFCLLTNKWTTTEDKWLHAHNVQGWQENNARAAIVFSLVSTGLWAGITFFALQRFRMGQAGLGGEDVAAGGTTAGGDATAGGYPGMPDHGAEQQQFGGGGPTQQTMGGNQYYTPTY
ncbi:synaptophysin / synaptoporin [Opisthorchis viverrini]|uniref:Synaptogyrin n=1 Tax=Opisthorchis viverrini TaxID=6198 RepID=A0A1S8X4Y3_OPIVI|nr:synaptophysin / synaptoporin [Opisthorchis viverrini]